MRAKIFRQDIQNECKAPLLKWKDDRLEYALNGKGGNLSERVISAWNINKEAAREIDRQRAQSQASHVSQTQKYSGLLTSIRKRLSLNQLFHLYNDDKSKIEENAYEIDTDALEVAQSIKEWTRADSRDSEKKRLFVQIKFLEVDFDGTNSNLIIFKDISSYYVHQKFEMEKVKSSMLLSLNQSLAR